MPPAAGTRLGPYEILAPLGAGGMGEVYRARDTRLGREVALKILPAALAFDAGRRARFEQEARAAAALNHPNIVGLHDVGEVEGVFYTVSELVPGETLEALIARGPLALRKLLDIAVQLADGMAAAHAARITHRDLKPANIMVTPEGRVKILDFGLARQASVPAVAPDATVTVHRTEPGMILGTVSYMSPEQARGAPADYRSDQFSFGLMVYEMATGRKAFEKPETVQTMSAILTEEPPPIERNLPAALRWAIERCLAKDPAERYESSRDLLHDLRYLRDHLSEVSGSSQVAALPAASAGRLRRWAVPAAAAIALAAAFAAGHYFAARALPDQSAYRFTPFAFDPGGQNSPLWSPDGKAVAYQGNVVTTIANQVFLRYLDAPAPVQVTHTDDDSTPVAWAPDGRRILIQRSSRGGLWSQSVAGGEPQLFMELKGVPPVAVSPDLRSVAAVRTGDDGVMSVWMSSPPGAAPKRYQPDPIATRTLYNSQRLRFSPDGKKLLLLIRKERGDEAWLLPYPPDPGHPPRQVFSGKSFYGGTPYFSWMTDSRHVALSFQSSPVAAWQIWMADTESREWRALTSGTAGQYSLDVSPDGRRIVFTQSGGNDDIATVDLEQAKASRMMTTERNEDMASWAVRRTLLAYVTDRAGPPEIWLHAPGAMDHPVVTARDFPPGTTQWFLTPALSPDGGRVIYMRVEAQGSARLWVSSTSGGAPVPLTSDNASAEMPGSWSPDGQWFTYLANRNGDSALMKVQTTGEAAPVALKPHLPTGIDIEPPVWSPAGDAILCAGMLFSPDGQKSRPIGDHHSPAYVFSPNGKLLYGIRHDGNRELLFSLDVASGAEKPLGDLGEDFRPSLGFHPALIFSLAPDGKSFVYTVSTAHSNLWMFEGYR